MKRKDRLFTALKLVLLMFSALFVGFPSSLVAQLKITGKIAHVDKSPIEFAEVILLNTDSMGVLSTLANEDGSFLLNTKQGLYILQVRQYRTVFFTQSIDVTTDLNLGTIEVENSAQELNAVDIEVKDKLIERKVDRVVFNVENSLRAVGGDALNVLSVTPGVRVQKDKLSMIGKSALAVMVDGKLIQLSGEDLANYLKTIPAGLIKSIEVMSIPPSQYDANGNSGYVNIKLKKGKKNAWNSLLNASYLQRTYPDGSASGNFNYNKNKLTLTASGFYRKGRTHFFQTDDTFFPDGKWTAKNSFNVDNEVAGGRLGVDYQLSPKWIVGSQLMTNSNSTQRAGNTHTAVQDYVTQNRLSYLQTENSKTAKPIYNTANIYNAFTLDTLGKKIVINLDYLNVADSDKKGYHGNSFIDSSYSYKYFDGLNINKRNITNFSAKVDVELPLKWINLSLGGKASSSIAQNDISFFNSGVADSAVHGNIRDKSKFEYQENVEALYVSGSKKINRHWESQVGFRGEVTHTKTTAENLAFNHKTSYLKLFPTAYLTYTINDNSAFTLRYSKRIDRPGFEDMNPNMYFLSPFQIVHGNAFLQPSFSDNFELVHAFKQLETKIYLTIDKNKFDQIPILYPSTSSIEYSNENYINSKIVGITESYILDKLDWWTSTNQFDVGYVRNTSNFIFATVLNGFFSTASTNNDFTLNKKKTVLFNASYTYNFNSVDGIYQMRPKSTTSLAFQFLMLDKNLKISVAATDIFGTENDKYTSSANGVKQFSYNYSDTRSIQISVSYKFGNKTITVEEREIGNEDEKIRAQ